VDIPLERFGIKEAADEEHLLAEVGQGRQHVAELHARTLSLGPPFFAVKAVAREEYGESDRRLAGRLLSLRLVAPDSERLQPRQCHANTNSAKHRAAGEAMGGHYMKLSRDPRVLRLWNSELSADFASEHIRNFAVRPIPNLIIISRLAAANLAELTA
jgi:hypothetical protein